MMVEDVTMVDKAVIVPETPTEHRRVFLSNIDLTLVLYDEAVSFFEPPATEISFEEVCRCFKDALRRMLVEYDFLAGRLEPALEDGSRLEINCNGAGVVFVAATTSCKLCQLGDLRTPKPEFKQLVTFLRQEEEKVLEFTEKPLILLQLTRFQCGGLAFANRSNHCTLDGVGVREFQINFASLTRGEDFVIRPSCDRTLFKARNPPQISHPHLEYSKPIGAEISFTVCGTVGSTLKKSIPDDTHLVYLSPERIASFKKAALKDGQLMSCSSFQAVAAKIWKARSLAMGLQDERISTVLFPVDVRRRIAPPAPNGFVGNALVPGFARARVEELKKAEDSFLVGKVKEGLERLDDEYIRSGNDWLEVHRGIPCCVDSFSVVSWWRLGLEGEELEFKWGAVKCVTPIMVKPGLVILLPDSKDDGGINICLELPSDQIKEFHKLMMEN
ncbi:PREDICTED: omega-hydroxypalmitate O-feruloyl transferase-like isoform X2 [Nelumbo nucifera]|uniref:Omega-hydroxypalmitate O-feruloyl transferase-like isoform X1 n=2 Tax=Nelumbo nucifera TaxID=4432 RepID=A0A1U7Z6M8_NELNU|nr:PREDICTED: omega-hydroxypalmitate O-feruloyl transferase-like isoform X1 [Nelumbo nucifera]XP_010248038.1 PREDICTED: omega-hydroxypalmitate O-feruloyl transferase-like isoform X2 [Nelumbo nucifera]DAD23978.1 TPA_asm: hypothetical protein HUJ06_025441 [Nelumbo nucifera]